MLDQLEMVKFFELLPACFQQVRRREKQRDHTEQHAFIGGLKSVAGGTGLLRGLRASTASMIVGRTENGRSVGDLK